MVMISGMKSDHLWVGGFTFIFRIMLAQVFMGRGQLALGVFTVDIMSENWGSGLCQILSGAVTN